MSSYGDVLKTIPAQNVQISRGSKELQLTNDVKVLSGRHAITTLNTRAGAIDSFIWRIREIEISVAWTSDLQTDVEGDNKLDDRNSLDFTQWTVKGLNASGTGTDITTNYQAAVYDYSVNAPDVGTSTIIIKLRIQRDKS